MFNVFIVFYFLALLSSAVLVFLSILFCIRKNRKYTYYFFLFAVSYFVMMINVLSGFYFLKTAGEPGNKIPAINYIGNNFFNAFSVCLMPFFFIDFLKIKVNRYFEIIVQASLGGIIIAQFFILRFTRINTVAFTKFYFYNFFGVLTVFTIIFTLLLIVINRKKINSAEKKILSYGFMLILIITIPLMFVQYMKGIFKLPDYIFFEPFIIILWSIFFLFYQVKFFFHSPNFQKKGAEKIYKSCNISEKEKEVVKLILKGYSNKEIARCMKITESTVKKHIHSIFKKVKVNTRIDLLNLFK